MRRTKNAFKPKTGRWVVLLPFSTTIAILCSVRIFTLCFLLLLVCVFWRDAEIFYFGCANLHMTARMCVCVLEFWQTLLLNCSASLCWFVGSESERIRAEDPKDKRPDCIPETFLTAAACKIAKIEIAEGPHETKKKRKRKKMINGWVASTGDSDLPICNLPTRIDS